MAIAVPNEPPINLLYCISTTPRPVSFPNFFKEMVESGAKKHPIAIPKGIGYKAAFKEGV